MGMICTDAVMYGTTEEQWIRDGSIMPECSREPSRENSPSMIYHVGMVRGDGESGEEDENSFVYKG